MKIAIVTITDGMNYGNRLQNYALQKVLESYGHSVETIRIRSGRDKTLVTEWSEIIKDITKKVLLRKDTHFMYRYRRRKFNIYNHKYISCRGISLLTKVKALKTLHEYDCAVCGSDQIWNVNYDFIYENIDFYLAHGANKKIAYAASFGISSLPVGMHNLFREELKTFQAIGVREETGKQILNDLEINNTDVVLDPTMLLSADEWKLVSHKPDGMDKKRKYVMTYFLSGRNDALKNHINRICCELDADAVNLEIEYMRDDEIEDGSAYAADPAEFLWFIENSTAVLTDSFHAAVFAILFHKPFVVYQRKAIENNNEIGSRMETLLKRFGLQKYIDDMECPGIYPKDYDYDMIEEVLKNDGNSSKEFLKKALTSCDVKV